MNKIQLISMAFMGLFVSGLALGDNMATRKSASSEQPKTEESQTTEQQEELKGRSVFVVNTTPAGVTVQTAFLSEEGKLMNMPAIFPDVDYAFAQIEELRRLVSRHFSEAAKLGGQVIQNQQSQEAPAQNNPTEKEKH